MKHLEVPVVLFVLIVLATTALAQIADWQAVERLPGGTKIHVSLIRGRTFGHCVLEGVNEDELSCDYPGIFGMRRRAVYQRDNIRGIYRVHNGALIGLGVGAVTGAALGAATYSKSNDPNFGRVGSPIILGGLLGGLGAAFGSALNPFFHGKTVYRNASPPPKQPSPKHAQKDDKTPAVAIEEKADQSPNKIPCLRDGATLQCVE